MVSKKDTQDGDTVSYCGSFYGETFSSRHSQRYPRLSKQILPNTLAQQLKNQPSAAMNTQTHESSSPNPVEPQECRFNKSFHHFRVVAVIMGGLSYGIMLALRYSIAVALLKMVDHEQVYLQLHPNSTSQDYLDQGFLPGGDFAWDNKIQQMIMSWYMFTYTLPQVFTTRWCLKIGATKAVPIAIAVCSLSTLLTPLAASYGGWQTVLLLRLINGLGGSPLHPLMLNMVEIWMPKDELTLGISWSCIMVCLVVTATNVVAGYLCAIHWVYVFYGFGSFGILFCLVWMLLITTPENNKLVSLREFNYIKGITNSAGQVSTSSQKQEQVPGRIRDVFLVPSFYAFTIIWICYACPYNSTSFILPEYLEQFLKIKIQDVGIYSTLINVGMMVGVLWPHPFIKLVKSQFNMGMTSASRIVMILSCLWAASAWFYIGLEHQFQMILFFVGRLGQMSAEIVVKAFIMSSFSETGIATVVFGMANTVGHLTVVFTSTATGYVLDWSGQSNFGWRAILWTMSLSQIVMMLLFCFCTRSEPLELKSQKKARLAKESQQTHTKLEHL